MRRVTIVGSRQSGEPCIHPIQKWLEYLADLHLDAVTVACGFLHDVVEDTEKRSMIWKWILVRMYENIVDSITKAW